MFLVKFCCASSRDNADLGDKKKGGHVLLDSNSTEIIEIKLARAANVLEGYLKFEMGLGMQKIDIGELMEMILGINSDNNEVPKREL